jgi:transposase
MQHERLDVTGGVDTHADQHVAAVVDEVGRILSTSSFPTDASGYRRLLEWMSSFGEVSRVGVEGTGAYGAGLARYLASKNIEVVEVDRPNRRLRRKRGKSDTTDAEGAARAALNGEASGLPKASNGPVESLRALRVARRSALKARTQASNQIRDLIVTAPEELRCKLRALNGGDRISACARLRPGASMDPTAATKTAISSLARRHQDLSAEIARLDEALGTICAKLNPGLLGAFGVGAETASALLVAAGDNPGRMRTEASFAALCGVSPVEASSGKVVRHRLNLGGNREANNALWRIVLVRLSRDQRTRDYMARRSQEGKSDREIMRCLKRYVAREVFDLLIRPVEVPKGADLRAARRARRATLVTVASELGSWPIRISELERGLLHDTGLALRYNDWLQNLVA